MGFYSTYVLPRLIDFAMRNPESARLRAEWIPKARGEVVEIGIGSGLNLPFYSSLVQRVYGVDPSLELHAIAKNRAKDWPVPVEFLPRRADEPLPFGDASIDTAVFTWTLCSIENAPKALEEVNRILRPDGQLIFVEHGRAPDKGVAQWQDRITPVWRRFTGGCHLNRKIPDLIAGAGFELNELKASYLPGPRPLTYTYLGIAKLLGGRPEGGSI